MAASAQRNSEVGEGCEGAPAPVNKRKFVLLVACERQSCEMSSIGLMRAFDDTRIFWLKHIRSYRAVQIIPGSERR